MHLRDVSHYVSRTQKQRTWDGNQGVLKHPTLIDFHELALWSKNFLTNFDEFRAKLLTGPRPPGYATLIDSLNKCASMPTMWAVTKDKGSERGGRFAAQFLPQNAGERCGEIHPHLLRSVSYAWPQHPPVYVSLSPQTAYSRRRQEVKAMTSLLRISDVQDRLCVSRSTVNRLIRNQKLECVHLGSSPRIPDDSVEKLIHELRTKRPNFNDGEVDS